MRAGESLRRVFTTYPASFLPEANGKGLHVRFPDLPEALTGGDDLEDTLAQATDCLAEAMAGRIGRGDEIPPPSKPKRGQRLISVPLYLAPKLALYLAMRERGMPNTRLAKRLGVSETVVRRMLNPRQHTKPEKIQAALAALGKRIVVTFEDAA
jgi:antitoxin HicB